MAAMPWARRPDFAADIALLNQLGINPIVVHGGGPQIGRMLERLGIKSLFVNGLRVTHPETIKSSKWSCPVDQ